MGFASRPLFVAMACFVVCTTTFPLPGAEPKEYTGPFAPQEALQTFRLPDGFRMELVAAEPDVLDPVAMSFDEDGRLYVIEMRDYPMASTAPAGRVRLLEDTDGDGRIDSSTVFVDGLKFPVGVMAWKQGVLVAAAPDILFFKDTDGDGKADVRKVLYTGFKEINPQHRANGLTYGIDNWIYAANSYGDIRPAAPIDAKALPSNGSDFRFRPDTHALELISGRSQFAMALDDWNNRFLSSNFNHIYHPVLQRHYLQRNPELAIPQVSESISDHGMLARVYPISKIEPRFNEFHHAGYSTTACGLTIHRSDTFPPEYRGNSFCCEPLHNLIHRDVLSQKGVSFVARRADSEQDRDFLVSSDNWFRPVNLLDGPDGALYIADFYRPVIEHPFGIPVELQKGLDFRAGDDRGRIYRIVHESSPPSPRPQLSSAGASKLVALLENENAWWRVTAQRLLVDRQDRTAVAPLEQLAQKSASAKTRLHALWTLEGLDALNTRLVRLALNDPQPEVREQALRLAEPRVNASPSLAEAVLQCAEDEHVRVRFQAAFTLGELIANREMRESVLSALAGLTVRDGSDRWFRSAILSSAAGAEVDLIALLHDQSGDFLESPGQGAIPFVRMLADAVGTRQSEQQIVRLLTVVAGDAPAKPAAWQLATLTPLVSRLHRAGIDLEPLTKTANVTAVLASWSKQMIEVATAMDRQETERVEAIGLLALAPTTEVMPYLTDLLRPQETQGVQRAAVRALSAIVDQRTTNILLDGWSTYTAPVREEILASLVSREDRIDDLLDAIEAGKIRNSELGLTRRDQVLRFPSSAVRKRAEKLLEIQTPADRKNIIEAVTAQVTSLNGDVDGGRQLFLKNCANCHNRRTETEGILHLSPGKVDVGPGLGKLRTRTKAELLNDILNPNRLVDPRFLNFVIATDDGRIVTGMIHAESPNSLTLQDGKELTVVTRSEIVEMQNSGRSLMPEGFEKNLTVQQLADLVTFLQH
jgi:putative membrane-bound dehydrogenase-like protein